MDCSLRVCKIECSEADLLWDIDPGTRITKIREVATDYGVEPWDDTKFERIRP